LARRPGGQRVTRLVAGQKPASQHVAGLKLDRLFRDAADALNQTRKWDDARVALWTTSAGRALRGVRRDKPACCRE